MLILLKVVLGNIYPLWLPVGYYGYSLLPQFSSGEGSEYSEETKDGGKREEKANTFEEQREIFLHNRRLAEEKGENEHGEAHTEHLTRHPHGGHHSGGDAVVLFFHGTHNGIGIGRREKGYGKA